MLRGGFLEADVGARGQHGGHLACRESGPVTEPYPGRVGNFTQRLHQFFGCDGLDLFFIKDQPDVAQQPNAAAQAASLSARAISTKKNDAGTSSAVTMSRIWLAQIRFVPVS
jgi:hypothetical protein